MNANLFVFYENSPSDEQKQFIEKEIKAFILKIDPQASPDITWGDGSWWITALWWLGEQSLEWFAAKGFDGILDQFKKLITHAGNSNKKNPESDDSGKSLQKSTSDYSLDYSSLYQSMNELMNTIDSGTGGTTKVVLGVYNNSKDVGRVVSLSKVEQDVTFSIMQTDSKDDYTSLMNP